MEKYTIAKFEPYGREPVLRRLKSGELVCLFLSGGPIEPHNDNKVYIAKSLDNGKTWSEPQILFSHNKRACWATELFTEGEKDTIFVHTYNAECWYRELQTFVSYCSEDGIWSEPISVKGTINGCSIRQGIKMSNGEYLFPLYWQEVASGFDFLSDKDFDCNKYPFVSGVGISSDNGKSFYRYGEIFSDCAVWEPNAVEVENGHIIMYCRVSKGALLISESFDYGRTWSKGRLSNIPNPDSKVTAIKVNGWILLINNFTVYKGNGFLDRNNLCIYKSKDGLNFEKCLSLENEEEPAFYPHAYVDFKEGVLYVAYENAKVHTLKKFTFKELGI